MLPQLLDFLPDYTTSFKLAKLAANTDSLLTSAKSNGLLHAYTKKSDGTRRRASQTFAKGGAQVQVPMAASTEAELAGEDDQLGGGYDYLSADTAWPPPPPSRTSRPLMDASLTDEQCHCFHRD